jgi:hypothetical protein
MTGTIVRESISPGVPVTATDSLAGTKLTNSAIESLANIYRYAGTARTFCNGTFSKSLRLTLLPKVPASVRWKQTYPTWVIIS